MVVRVERGRAKKLSRFRNFLEEPGMVKVFLPRENILRMLGDFGGCGLGCYGGDTFEVWVMVV